VFAMADNAVNLLNRKYLLKKWNSTVLTDSAQTNDTLQHTLSSITVRLSFSIVFVIKQPKQTSIQQKTSSPHIKTKELLTLDNLQKISFLQKKRQQRWEFWVLCWKRPNIAKLEIPPSVWCSAFALSLLIQSSYSSFSVNSSISEFFNVPSHKSWWSRLIILRTESKSSTQKQELQQHFLFTSQFHNPLRIHCFDSHSKVITTF
jgi:hypothetical protein